MIPGSRCLFCLAIVCWPQPARARPLFHFEHTWSVTAGDYLFGLRQVVQTPGDIRWTQVWIGRYSFHMKCRAAEVVALLLRPPTDMAQQFYFLADWRSFRRLP